MNDRQNAPLKLDLHFQVLRQAIRAVPAVKWALGVAGLVAAVGIIGLLVREKWMVAIVGTVILLVLMTMLVVFARIAALQPRQLKGPIVVFVWFVLILTCAFAVTLFTTVTMAQPATLARLLGITRGPTPVVPFKHTYKFTQPAFNISAANGFSSFKYGFSSLGVAEQIRGRGVKITKIRVNLDVTNNTDSVCCDVWTYLGPSEPPFPTEGGQSSAGNPSDYTYNPVLNNFPVKAELVIGNHGMAFPQGHHVFWASYDFLAEKPNAFPFLDLPKSHNNTPLDLDRGLYAQVFVWAGNPAINIDVNRITLDVEGTMPR